MQWVAPTVTREIMSLVSGEREMLHGWLEFHRRTLQLKCAGLTAQQLKERSAAPSTLSLLGLIRHMTEIERMWFRRNFAAQEIGFVYRTPQSPDAEFDDVDSADAETDFAAFRAEIAAADAAIAGHDLDEIFIDPLEGNEINLRWAYVHMIEEYARHCGHADLLRERIDGVTGS